MNNILINYYKPIIKQQDEIIMNVRKKIRIIQKMNKKLKEEQT